MADMPPRKAAMTPAEFRSLMGTRKQGEVAALLGVSIRSVNRWACGKGAINEFTAKAIRDKLRRK